MGVVLDNFFLFKENKYIFSDTVFLSIKMLMYIVIYVLFLFVYRT